MSNNWKENRRNDYKYFVQIPTRWIDTDVYQHVNNVNYYSFFDTVIGRYLIEKAGLNITRDPVVGFCVESSCSYFKPLKFPEIVDAGLRVAHIGNTSARYEIGLFKDKEISLSAAGYFVHAFVCRSTQKSKEIPEKIRKSLKAILA
ncbi:MAG: thioesterase [Rhodospirillaceae bacterium]|nr:thioesterase [Rhodospirillaceae bacterium]